MDTSALVFKINPIRAHEGPQLEYMCSSTLSLTSALNVFELSRPNPGHFTTGKYSIPIVQEVGWVPVADGTGAEILATTGVRSPDRPACSYSLYGPTAAVFT